MSLSVSSSNVHALTSQMKPHGLPLPHNINAINVKGRGFKL